MGKIAEWLSGERERKKLSSQKYDEAAAKFGAFLGSITEEAIEIGIDPPTHDVKKWVLELDETHWKILSKITGRIEEGDLAKQRAELLARIRGFRVGEAPHGYFVESQPFDNSRTVADPTGSHIKFFCQLNQKDQEAFTNLALPARKLWNQLKEKPTEAEEER
jgi:hypothetical protein